jgi:alpha-L-fucosidase
LQPDCLVTDLNASHFDSTGLFYGDIKAFEQNAGEVSLRRTVLSRLTYSIQILPADSALPAFSCVTLTDGWFWKQADINAELKSTYRVVHDWLLPQNAHHCTLIVNAAPNREGRLAPNIVERLHEIGRAWHHPGPAPSLSGYMEPVTTKNLAQGAMVHCSGHADG